MISSACAIIIKVGRVSHWILAVIFSYQLFCIAVSLWNGEQFSVSLATSLTAMFMYVVSTTEKEINRI